MTLEEVAAAKEALEAEGRTPTLDALRQRLGRGSRRDKPRHDLRYTRVHFSRPYPVRTNSNSTNCCVEKDLWACRRRV